MRHQSRYLLAIALAVAVIQIGVLASMIVSRAAILRDGREVVLEVHPVDPRDLLRGDYVRIGYNISSLPKEIFEGVSGETGDVDGSAVFVRLEAGEGGIWNAVSARFGEPPSAARAQNQVDIRGATPIGNVSQAQLIAVDYGIERFYLPEGEGKSIEEGLGERPFRMIVAVDDSGAAQIKAFYDGDTLIYREPLY
ncbi:MAG: GDYXXLXY domain-containing protein [Rhizobiaceae bacterium]|nr:GDYXXLXY domain-containing protein [Rhizobiaceae bacterium]